ncbi:MAG TPA: bacillithiol system redox-active protein YtxJ [Flavobacterium sp.]|nr:bacillithiol system redox-active protein YtxJ [Flavobacterium sp.]
MNFFNKLFGNTSPENMKTKLSWNILEHSDQLEMIIQNSWERPVLIFKHSTRCIISKSALRSFESGFDLEDKMTLYYLDLLQYRNISNEIAEVFGIVHQSPQILLIKNGKVIYNESHEGIDAGVLKEFV